jgi:hypothetical protein
MLPHHPYIDPAAIVVTILTKVKILATTLFRAPKPSAPITENTFIVWEPCTHSHAEVLPGYVRYLLDLGFDVSVFATPERFDEGLFSRFSDKRITLNRLSQGAIRRLFRKNGLLQAKGILITTARKISGKGSYDAEFDLFSNRRAEQKVLLVEHDIRATVDNGSITPEIITLRKSHYKNTVTTVVNPHYFGQVEITTKSSDVINFITIGAMRGKRRNTHLMIEAAKSLHAKGITNFKLTIIGRGTLSCVPKYIRKYFSIRGRVGFSQLYTEMEQADFFLPLLDPESPLHERYITTGTSGSFQLIYGFAKPCLIASKFATINGFNNNNSIIYSDNNNLVQAMCDAIFMTQDDYAIMQQDLKKQTDSLYAASLKNLHKLVYC